MSQPTFLKNLYSKSFLFQGIFWGKVPILMTTAGHYSNEEHINCVYVTFSNTTVDLFVKYDKRFVLVLNNIFKRTTNNRSVSITVVALKKNNIEQCDKIGESLAQVQAINSDR